ncbi:type VI secretion system ATPase TssH [Aquisalimonas sp. 2447]|uniref:type VI secretion system ATPase TssH n=1 Tax=Aquisalimonas sp. 2447 TaxID=2740807 RepID=UPI0014324949|nr:type VI secretion system ATPase TssH [Aquisalimonas sp. 2447]QIT55971.1 type VI secretion system ATPase TssH [Aquisalimonas sp. 2447]
MELEQLIKHMTPACRELFEQAVSAAASRSHRAVEIEHWLDRAAQRDAPDVRELLAVADVEVGQLHADVQAAMERLRTGHSGFPAISSEVTRLLFEGWMAASSEFQCLEIRASHLVLALARNDALRVRASGISTELAKLDEAQLRDRCAPLFEPAASAAAPVDQGGTSALDQFTVDLTEQARRHRIDPVVGREREIRQMIDVLCRRRQNNPILTGEAGVGKTAVVEGLARRIVSGEVPEALRGVSLRSLDVGLLQAGAGVKGEFENRLKNVIREVQNAPAPVILFIDEAHTLIGAGNQSGSADAANLLKPALARGELRTIAATTWREYKKYVEGDAALTRRFQVVHVEEPTREQAVVMLREFAPHLEAHHGVEIMDEAITAAVHLSARYIPARQLPDKCVSLLDTACARVNLSQNSAPGMLEDLQQRADAHRTELERLRREHAMGAEHLEPILALEQEADRIASEQETLAARWQREQELTAALRDLKRRLHESSQRNEDVEETDAATADAPETLRRHLQDKRRELASQQGETPLLHERVDAQVVASVIADWTGIPVGRMQVDEIHGVLGLREAMQQRVVGQDHALNAVVRTMQTARSKLGDPRRPLGVFLLVGPSGVGKTETALALAEQLYGSDDAMTVINMSEFKEEHKVSMLTGSPPGYVGYGEGGVLTEAVRRRPYSVVLLDEMEKAHPGVQDIFYQVFDKGSLRDGEGRDIDFTNTVIVMTTNTASEQIHRLADDPDTCPEPEGLVEAIRPALAEVYKPAFLGRVDVIPYYPLGQAAMAEIVRLQLAAIQNRVRDNYDAALDYTPALLDHIIQRCRQSDTGARQISAAINQTLLPAISDRLLRHLAQGGTVADINVDVDANDGFCIQVHSADDAGAPHPTPQEREERGFLLSSDGGVADGRYKKERA